MLSLVATFIIIYTGNQQLAKADYRAFELKIEDQKNNTSRAFKSTLDHLQYKMIYPLSPSETISYTKTWRCRGNTQFFKDICTGPD